MKIIETNCLNELQKKALFNLWNQEYPRQLKFISFEDLDTYLNNLQNPTHYFGLNEKAEIVAWAFVFERDREQWFAIIVDNSKQKKGCGTQLLNHLKTKVFVLNGWVIDHENDIKQNGKNYSSPLSFYTKNKFIIFKEERLETEKISAVKIKWISENKDNDNL